jgi:hypothetical protein
MANIVRALAITLLGAAAFAADHEDIPSPEDWYKNDYAPLYGDKPGDRAAEIAGHFADQVQVHGADPGTYDSLSWMSGAIEEWLNDGWLRSELAALQFDQLNSHTAAFKAKWRDYYTHDVTAYECGWYLADVIEGRWRITEYATIQCDEHGL